MAYNRKNLLKKVINIQETYNQFKAEGVSTAHVFRKHIEPRWHISYYTFHRYLGIPAKAELKKIEQQELTTKSNAQNKIALKQASMDFSISDDESGSGNNAD